MWKGLVTSVFRYEKVIFEAENEGNFLPKEGGSNDREMRETPIDMGGLRFWRRRLRIMNVRTKNVRGADSARSCAWGGFEMRNGFAFRGSLDWGVICSDISAASNRLTTKMETYIIQLHEKG